MTPSQAASDSAGTATALQASRVVTLGESIVLLTAQGGQPLSRTQSCFLAIAGAESNVALYLRDAGVPVSWLSAVGTDPFGIRLPEYLPGHGVDTSRVFHDGQRRTGIFFKDQTPRAPLRGAGGPGRGTFGGACHPGAAGRPATQLDAPRSRRGRRGPPRTH